MVLIETKKEQLSAIVNTYQALGGGLMQKPPAMPGSPDVAAGGPPPAIPAAAPNDLANPGPKPAAPGDLPPALP